MAYLWPNRDTTRVPALPWHAMDWLTHPARTRLAFYIAFFIGFVALTYVLTRLGVDFADPVDWLIGYVIFVVAFCLGAFLEWKTRRTR